MIGATLYRFGPDSGSDNRLLTVGQLDEDEDPYVSVVGDDVAGVNPYNPIYHQASTELVMYIMKGIAPELRSVGAMAKGDSLGALL